MKKIICLFFFLAGMRQMASAHLLQNPKWLEKDTTLLLGKEDMNNWQDAKFGLFVHYGLYALLEKGEWVQFFDQIDVQEYAKLKDKFTASKFNGAAWVQVAKDAGCKYMVVTSRHHDGFSLFDTKTSDFNSVNSPAHKDLMTEYTSACRAAGLLVGIYYSPLDWRFPGFFFPGLYRSNAELMKKQTYDQVKELLSNYGKIDILWYDGGGDDWLGFGGLDYANHVWGSRDREKFNYKGSFHWEPIKLNSMVRQLQPKVAFNGRSGMVGDFDVMEVKFANKVPDRPWEFCTTLTTNAWGWKKNTPVMTSDSCIRLMVKVVSQGGNFCLNVGPRPDGEIDPPQVAVLKKIGAFLKLSGESIYGTRAGEFHEAWGGTTVKPDAVYVHVLDVPRDGKISLPITKKIKKATCLVNNQKVSFAQTAQGVTIQGITGKLDQSDLVIKLSLK